MPSEQRNNRGARRISTFELVLFAMLGALMFYSKILMEWAPNIHFLGMLTMTYTIVFRKRALIPIYVYVLLNGLYIGFSLWWVPYLYIWTILWGATMLLPQNMAPRVATPVYMAVCGLHGLAFGTLYAPFQALAFHLTPQAMLAWIIAGLRFDVIHAAGNFVLGALIYPLSRLLKRLCRGRIER